MTISKGLRISLSILLCFLQLQQAKAQTTKIANYTIDAVLHPKQKTISGHQTLVWINTTPHAVKDLHFHLYLNAFKDMYSTFMKESGGGKLRNDYADTSNALNFGGIKLQKVLLNHKTDLLSVIRFIQPDDLNFRDQTVLKIPLPFAVKPGERIELEMRFESKLPKIFARTGWAADNYFFVGQWFPKIGVLEEDGSWNCHQFHANTEFYADFGDYQVNITVPSNFVVAATGLKTSEVKLKSGLKKLSYRAENVHDFAWTASPHFVEIEEKYKNIALHIFMQKEQVGKVQRYLKPLKASIDFMEKHVGRYPHPVLSLIDPSFDGSGSGGMEYPMLITAGADYGIGKWYRYQEVVTIHEFVHQYFQGLLASNEFENSWLDEGFTQYMEGRIFEATYPSEGMVNLLGLVVDDFALSRFSYASMHNPRITAIRRDAWKYPGGTYEIMSYTKTATVLKTLENLVGVQVMDKILQTYFERFKFKHPKPEDFFAVASEVAARYTKFSSLGWFFDQTILQSKVCDYTVSNLRVTNGESTFVLENLQDMKIPVAVVVTFEDGKQQEFEWGGTTKKVRLKGKIRSVEIDPHRKNLMDINLVNNSFTSQPPYSFYLKYGAKFLFWMQNLLIFS